MLPGRETPDPHPHSSHFIPPSPPPTTPGGQYRGLPKTITLELPLSEKGGGGGSKINPARAPNATGTSLGMTHKV